MQGEVARHRVVNNLVGLTERKHCPPDKMPVFYSEVGWTNVSEEEDCYHSVRRYDKWYVGRNALTVYY